MKKDMKEHPILFSAPMVQAILEGRKTQTRRAMKKQPNIDPQTGDWLSTYSDGGQEVHPIETWIGVQVKLHCPFGRIGDRLWARETWKHKGHNFPVGHPYEYRATAEQDLTPPDGPWKPSIFMPRAASRITLEITDIRCERLNDISEADAIAEGIEPVVGQDGETYYGNYGKEDIGHLLPPVESYRSLWQSINGPESWEANPLVWVITFKRVE